MSGETAGAFIQVRCTDMEDYARVHNDGYATAVEQFGELLADARSDLAPEAGAGDLMAWLDDAVKAMSGGVVRPLLDREQVKQTLHLQGAYCGTCDYETGGCSECDFVLGKYATAVLELARPMPTQAELTDWLREIFTADPGGTPFGTAAEELLALLKGAQS